MNRIALRRVRWVSLLLLVTWCAPPLAANPNPNEPAYRYEIIKENAGRSPLPQPREVFVEPLAFETETDLAPETPATGIVNWRDAPKYLNADPITVQGEIVDTYQIRDIVCRLQFARYRDEPRAFYVAIFREAYEGLDQPPTEFYMGKTIRATGQVTLHRGQANLEVRDLGAIEIVEP